MITTSFDSAKEMVEKMLKGGVTINGEWYEENCEEAYLDWGVVGDMFQNVISKYIADQVGHYFLERGYNVFYQCMGWGSNAIPQGTPICIRIRKSPKRYACPTMDLD